MDNFGREEISDLKNTSVPGCINMDIVLFICKKELNKYKYSREEKLFSNKTFLPDRNFQFSIFNFQLDLVFEFKELVNNSSKYSAYERSNDEYPKASQRS